MKTSIIISYKESGTDRFLNAVGVVNYLARLIDDNTELIVVEQDSEIRAKWIDDNKNIRHIFLPNEGVFNKGWGYNVGVKASQGDILIFNDADLFIPLMSYKNYLPLLLGYDVVDPYKSIYYFSELGSRNFIQRGYDFSMATVRTNYLYEIGATVVSGGIFMINRNKFIELKGFDEECTGFGYEDNIFDEKMRKCGLSVKQIDDHCIHLHHKSIRDRASKYDEFFRYLEINKALYELYSAMERSEIELRIANTESWGEMPCESSL